MRVITLPFPDWQKTSSVAARRKIQAILDDSSLDGVDRPINGLMREISNQYHPFFIARDELVETTFNLLSTDAYAAVVVNYTHLLRVLAELTPRLDLPPSVVITHDALSRLPTQFQNQAIDTACRACSPDLEAAALNAIDGTRIVAISRSELKYFKDIGVRNEIVLSEYDAFEEGKPFQTTLESFRHDY